MNKQSEDYASANQAVEGCSRVRRIVDLELSKSLMGDAEVASVVSVGFDCEHVAYLEWSL